APGQWSVRRGIDPVGAALGERLHDHAVGARLERDLDVTVDGRDERGCAPQHGPLAGQEELARRARPYLHSGTSHPSTSAPLPGAHVSTRSTPGTAPSAPATCGASS